MAYLLHYYGHQWPFPQGASAGPYEEFSGLGYYRPNQAMYRGIYSGVSRTMGDTSIDPTSINLTDPGTLLMIAGAGFILWNLFKGGRRATRSIRRYRRRRRARSRPFEPDLPYGGMSR
jgi:hypothetical protein